MHYKETAQAELKLAVIIVVITVHVAAAIIGVSYFLSMYQTVGSM